MNVRIILLLFVLILCCHGQILDKMEPLAPEIEAWLDRNIDRSLQFLNMKGDPSGKNAIAEYNKGYLYYLNGNNSEALTYLQRSLEQPDPTPYAYYLMAKIYEESGNFTGARMQINRALKMDGQNYDFLLELGRLYELDGQEEQAINTYRQIIDLYEDMIPPRVYLGKILTMRRQYEAAQTVLEPEEVIYPEHELLLTRARFYDELGNKEKAAELIMEMCRAYSFSEEIKPFIDTLQIKYNISNPDLTTTIPRYKFRIQPTEKIDYKVKYGFVTLGWVNVRMGKPAEINGRQTIPVTFFVNSNPDFDFLISLHHIYESYIDIETLNAIRTRIYTPGDENFLIRVYNFNYGKNRFNAQRVHSNGRFSQVNKLLPNKAQDGVSMLYFARGVVSNRTGGTTTVIIDEEYKYGHITYLNETEEVDVIDDEVEAIKIFARAEFSGIAGMNGDAWGWFSPDSEHTPLQGKISIILGSISINVTDEVPIN